MSEQIYKEEKERRGGEILPIQCFKLSRERAQAGAGRLHYHDYTELLFGLVGNGQVYVGTQCVELRPGTLVVIQSGDAHDVQCTELPCEYIVVKFLPKLLISAEQTGAEFGYALTLMEQLPSRQLVFLPEELEGTEIPQILRRMLEEKEAERFGYELSLRADVTRVTLFLLRRWQERSPWMQGSAPPAQRAIMQTVLAYIGEHYAELCEQDVARACGISPVAVSRLFSQTMKCSFPDYVCSVRLREAERLLLTTDQTVTEIAQQVGFSTAAYFIARFRAMRGVTPSRFRRSGAAGTAPEAVGESTPRGAAEK